MIASEQLYIIVDNVPLNFSAVIWWIGFMSSFGRVGIMTMNIHTRNRVLHEMEEKNTLMPHLGVKRFGLYCY